MQSSRPTRDSELTALLIAPNRELADMFLATIPQVRGFQVLGDLRTYPVQQTLEIRLRQLRPEVILIDLTTNIDQAGELIKFLASVRPTVFCIGLHSANDSEAILQCVRQGASEFLFSPFDVTVQRDAVARLRRLRQPEPATEPDHGKVIIFSSAKPGSGASTLATQTAFALKRATGRRVLLADFDLTGGTIGFFLKLSQRHSLVQLLESGSLDVSRWSEYTVSCGGVDVLTAPEAPFVRPMDAGKLQEVVQFSRFLYDWIVIDLPTIFNRLSLLAMSEADRGFLVSTSELPSLHLMKKAIGLLNQIGFNRERVQVVLNRVNKRDGIAGSELGKLFDCPVHASFPNDYFSLHRVITLGRPLANDCELGRAIEGLAAKITGPTGLEKKRVGQALGAKPAMSETY